MAMPKKILVMGSNGRLGKALLRRYAQQGIEVSGLSRAELDLAKPELVASTLAAHSFDVLINAAGDTDVDRCEGMAAAAHVVNAASPTEAARYCAAHGATFVQVSTDYVFSGDGRAVRKEDDVAEPINHYGESKRAGEIAVLAACPQALVVRVSWLFGLEKPSFPDRMIREALAKEDVSAVDDKWACPTYADDVCDWLLALLKGGCTGIVHLCNQGFCTWQEYGEETLKIGAELGLPLKTRSVAGHTMVDFPPFKAARPPFTALSTNHFTSLTGIEPRHWKDALREYLQRTLPAKVD